VFEHLGSFFLFEITRQAVRVDYHPIVCGQSAVFCPLNLLPAGFAFVPHSDHQGCSRAMKYISFVIDKIGYKKKKRGE